MSLQVWLPLNGHIRNQGLNDATISLVNNPTVVSSNRGQCYNFNPNNENNQAIEIACSQMPEWVKNEISVAFWVYHRETDGRSILFGNHAYNGSYTFNIEKLASSNKLRVYMHAKPDYTVNECVLDVNTWTHIVVVKSTTDLKIYKNGVLVNTRAHISSDLWKSSDGVKYRIGRDNRSDATALNGMMSDFRIYDHTLSQKEIKNLAQGLILNLTFDNPHMTKTTNILAGLPLQGHGSDWTVVENENHLGEPIYRNTVTTPDTGNNAGFRYTSGITPTSLQSNKITLSFYKRLNTVYGKNLGGYIRIVDAAGTVLQSANWTYNKSNWANDSTSLGKWEKITATATFSDTAMASGVKFSHLYVYVDKATGGVCDFSHIQLEWGSEATGYVNGTRESEVEDSSGFGNHGRIVGPHYLSTDTVKGKYSVYTDGVDRSSSQYSYIIAPLNMSEIKSYTIMGDIKIAAWGAQTSGIFSLDTSERNSNAYYTSPCHHRDSYFDISAASNTSATVSDTYKRLSFNTSDLPAGKWANIAVKYDGQIASLYINGVLKRQISFPAPTTLKPCNYAILSFSLAGGAYRVTKANWANFRAYTTALSDEDILNLATKDAALDRDNNYYCFDLNEEFEITPNLSTSGVLNTPTQDYNFANMYSGTQYNGSQMSITYNYPTDVFKDYGFDRCTKFTATSTSTEKFLAYSYILPTSYYTPSGLYTFSCYAYVPSECNANLRINLEQSTSWVKNYKGTTSNLNDETKDKVIKVWGTIKANTNGQIYIMFYPNPNQANVFTKGYFLIAGMTVVPGDVPMHPVNETVGPNLITTMTAGGRTTLNGTHGLNADFSQNLDTYGYFNLSEPLRWDTVYRLSFNVSNFPTGGKWEWQLWNKSNYKMVVDRNGIFHYTFIPRRDKLPVKDISLTKFLFDDGGRSGAANMVSFTNFKIVECEACQAHGFFETNKAAIHKNYIEMNSIYEG